MSDLTKGGESPPQALSSLTKAQPGRKSRGIGRDASLTLELLSTPKRTAGLAVFHPLANPSSSMGGSARARRPIDRGADAIRL